MPTNLAFHAAPNSHKRVGYALRLSTTPPAEHLEMAPSKPMLKVLVWSPEVSGQLPVLMIPEDIIKAWSQNEHYGSDFRRLVDDHTKEFGSAPAPGTPAKGAPGKRGSGSGPGGSSAKKPKVESQHYLAIADLTGPEVAKASDVDPCFSLGCIKLQPSRCLFRTSSFQQTAHTQSASRSWGEAKSIWSMRTTERQRQHYDTQL